VRAAEPDLGIHSEVVSDGILDMIAINSAVEIDLTGQVCAESIGSKIYSSVGGQMDFLRGAALPRGGKPIIAMASTAKDGAVSRIVPTLQPGAGVTTSRAHVHYVATEYGVVTCMGSDSRSGPGR
jgi:4-hydroxybutyrate CoA-transferase